jgi:hypothetical protein
VIDAKDRYERQIAMERAHEEAEIEDAEAELEVRIRRAMSCDAISCRFCCCLLVVEKRTQEETEIKDADAELEVRSANTT